MDLGDLQRSYGCRLRNTATGKLVSSSGAAQLILTGNGAGQHSAQPTGPIPQLVHSLSQLIADDTAAKRRSLQLMMQQWPLGRNSQPADWMGQAAEQADWRLLVPCALKRPLPAGHTIRWLYQPTSSDWHSTIGGSGDDHELPINQQERAVPLSDWAASRSIAFINNNIGQPEQVDNHGNGSSSSASSSRRATMSRSMANSAEHKLQQQFAQRYLASANQLTIEWPTSAQSGRYICQLVVAAGAASDELVGSTRTLCDTNVIIRRPIELSLELASQYRGGSPITADHAGSGSQVLDSYPKSARQGYEAGELAGSEDEFSSSLLGRAAALLGWRHRRRPHSSGQAGRSKRSMAWPGNSLLDLEPGRVQVLGSGSIEAPPVVQVGQLLRLNCRGRGHPIETVRWYKNGQLINTQSSNDFQVQITTNTSFTTNSKQQERDDNNNNKKELLAANESQRVLSSLLVRQLQPKDVGLSMFECFAQNSLGDRARAGKLVFVLEQPVLEWARSLCPIKQQQQQPTAGNRLQVVAANPASELANELDEALDDDLDLDFGDSASLALAASDTLAASRSASLFRRHNPMLRALVLEAEPVELQCPLALVGPDLANESAVAHLRWPVEWRRWSKL